MTGALHVDGRTVAVLGTAAADALDVCTRTELAARAAASALGELAPVTRGLADLAQLAHRCGVALERWCATTDDAVATFVAVEAGLAISSPQRDASPRSVNPLERPVTRLAPYLDDVGHATRYAAVVGGVGAGLTPAAARTLTTLPGRVAREMARLLPEGSGRAIPAGTTQLPVRATASVAGWLQTIEDLPRGTIGVAAVGAGWVVSLPGIHSYGDAPDPMDLYGAVRGLAGGTSAYPRAVVKALDLACVPIGAPVMLVGHSQGGITALDLAADLRVNGRRVHITHVVTAGSPVSGVHPIVGTRVLELDNDDDVVPQLDLRDSRRGTGDDRVVAVFRHDDGTIRGDHGLATAYVPFVQSTAFVSTPGVLGWIADAQRYFDSTSAVQQQRFALRDH